MMTKDMQVSQNQKLKVDVLRRTPEQRPHQCSICSKSFKTKTHLKTHVKTHSSEKPFPCHQCQHRFSTKGILGRHIIEIHSTNPARPQFQCTTCLVCVKRKETLQAHYRTHQQEKRYSCNDCENSFSTKPSLKRHLLEIHSMNSSSKQHHFQCHICHIYLKRKYNLQRHHLVVHGGQRRFSCTYCNKSFSKNSTLLHHVRTHTGEKPYGCGTCEYKFTSRSGLIKHLRVHSDVRPYICPICHHGFKSQYNLNHHMKVHSTVPSLYSCSYCQQSYKTKISLEHHIRCHTGENPFQCAVCTKTFANEINYRCHIKCHNAKPYCCSICGMLFKTQSLLQLHMESRNGTLEKSFVCPETNCCYVAAYKSGFEEHALSHNQQNIKGYYCKFCQLSFRRLNLLKSHMESHMQGEGDRSCPNDSVVKEQITCETCNRIFSNESRYRRHMRRHITKPYSCTDCWKLFSSNELLQLHVKAKNGTTQKPYPCPKCCSSFPTRSRLTDHTRKTHLKKKVYNISKNPTVASDRNKKIYTRPCFVLLERLSL